MQSAALRVSTNGFALVGTIDVAPMLAALAASPEAFDADTWRRELPHSPHRDSDVLILRGPPSAAPRDVLHSLDVVDRPAFETAAFKDAVIEISRSIANRPPARAMVTRLRAGGKIQAHIDIGEYAERTERYHVALATNPEAWLDVADERRHLPVGEVWWIDKHTRHFGANDGATDRLHLIVDVWAAA